MRNLSKALAATAGVAVLAGGVLAGCGGDSAPAASSLVGTWEGTATGYSRGENQSAVTLTVVITDADDANRRGGPVGGDRHGA